jgi:CRP-like cAMP-binding protein
MSTEKIAIENVQPGSVLDEDIYDAVQDKMVYSRGARLTAEMINHILSLDYTEIQITTTKSPEAKRMPEKMFKPGEFICFQGEPANHIYILKEGSLQIMICESDPPLANPEEARRYVMEHGRVVSHIQGKNIKFGEMGGILHGYRNASVRCSSEVSVVEIKADRKTLRASIQQNPKLGISMALNMGLRLSQLRHGISLAIALHEKILSRISGYHEVFERIKASLENKERAENLSWLTRLVEQISSIPPLTSIRKSKRTEIKKPEFNIETEGEILPVDYEHFLNIGTSLTEISRKEKVFFILKKGRINVDKEDKRIGVHHLPGELMFYEKLIGGRIDPELILKVAAPSKLYKIPLTEFEELCMSHSRFVLFLCASFAQFLWAEGKYQLHVMEALEKDLNRLSVGDENYRRAFRKLSRMIERFSKETSLTEKEFKLSESIRQCIDNDYSTMKESFSSIFTRKTV